MEVTLLNAIAIAVENAAVDQGFLNVLERNRRPQMVSASYGNLALSGQAPHRGPIRDHLTKLIEAAVTIEPDGRHGSGFIVSRDGYLLTNAHVVGEGQRVPVVFRNGVRVSGTVERVARARDVALVKIPITASFVLPVGRQDMLAVGDAVYVVGSPADPSLRSTVTSGIVSAFRTFDGKTFIQSDAAVTGGNSGGPLLDARGNVVGITVAKVRDAENLNLFVPIADALKALNVEIVVD